MKYWDFSCADCLGQQTTGSDHVLVHLELQHLTNDVEVSLFVQQWVEAIQGMPEQQRGQMALWWRNNVGKLYSRSRTHTRSDRLDADGSNRRQLRQMRTFVAYVTLMEWCAMGRRRELWDDYVNTRATRISHKRFFKEFRAYEKKSLVDRSMLLAHLHRGGWFYI